VLKKINLLLSAFFFVAITLTGCSEKSEKRLVIWTDNSEFAQYLEVYNEYHKTKAVMVYKENLAASLPPARDELQPDVIAGTWLRNSKVKKNFLPLNFLFERRYLNSNDFYTTLLNVGKSGNKQYLLPVNFNLPAIIFSIKNESVVENSYTISLDQLRKAGAAFNKKNKKGAYTAIGFAPQSSTEFMYTVSKIKGANFREEKKGTLLWDNENLQKSISFLNQWITTENSSTQTESDFVYKYLSVSADKRVTSGKTLFSYTTSDNLFLFSNEQMSKIDFRWLSDNGELPVEDSFTTMGISAKAEHKADAADFISWFFTADSQRILIERKKRMNLDNMKFGIAGGFSTIKTVNEHILPVHYTRLLSNIPDSDSFHVFARKPSDWDRTKKRVIFPYIEESVASIPGKNISSIEERYAELKKLSY
jgi:ABC-type glycerol-3-phosphate transport system substrate-binding protein